MKCKNISLALLCAAIVGSCVPTGAQEPITVEINNKYVAFRDAPFLMDDIIMMPLRKTAEMFDYLVLWNGQQNSIELLKADTTAAVAVGSGEAIIRDAVVKLPCNVMLYGETTYVPVKFFKYLLDVNIIWNADNQALSLLSDEYYQPGFALGPPSQTASAAGIEDSLLNNSDFENGVQGWINRNSAVLRAESVEVHSGSGALAFACQPGAAFSSISTNVTNIFAENGPGTYKLEFWAKTDGKAVSMEYYMFRLNDDTSNQSMQKVALTSEWKKFTITASPKWDTLNTATMIVSMDSSAYGTTVFIDDIVFVKSK